MVKTVPKRPLVRSPKFGTWLELQRGRRSFERVAQLLRPLVADAGLKVWGRWPVVDRQADADLVATITGTGSNRAGTVIVTVKHGSNGSTLWQSEDTGHRWFGPQSAFLRALDVLMERLKEASNQWPQS